MATYLHLSSQYYSRRQVKYLPNILIYFIFVFNFKNYLHCVTN